MPLSAILNNKRLISTTMSDEEWAGCKSITSPDKFQLVMAYSRLPCFPRVSKNGLRHFAHRPGQSPETSYKETEEHLRMKSIIVESAISQGWEAETEVRSPDGKWIADTLLVKGGVKIAVEVQWSRQDYLQYRFRQKRYADAGIRCCWIYRHDFGWDYKETQSLPAFQVEMPFDFESPSILVSQDDDDEYERRPVLLKDFVSKLLDGDMSYRSVTPVTVIAEQCWKCKSEVVAWWCTSGVWTESSLHQVDRIEARQDVVAEIRKRYPAKAAYMKMAWTKASGVQYMAFHCSGCSAVQGDMFIWHRGSTGDWLDRFLMSSESVTGKDGRWLTHN